MSNQHRQSEGATWGWAVLITIFVAVVVIFNLDRLVELTRQRHLVVGVFPTGGAVRPGTRVWLAGRDIGRVRTVEIEPVGDRREPGLVVRMRVIRAAGELIRRDSRLGLGPPAPMADPVVKITPGTAAAPVIGESDTLWALPPVTLGDVMDRTTEFLVRLDTMLSEAQTLEPPLRVRERVLRRLEVNYDAAARDLESLADALETSPLRELSDPAFRRRLDRIAESTGGIAERANELMATYGDDSPDGRAIRTTLRSVRDRMRGLGVSFEQLRADLDHPNSTLSRLQRDSALSVAARGVQAQIDSLVAEAVEAGPGFFYEPR